MKIELRIDIIRLVFNKKVSEMKKLFLTIMFVLLVSKAYAGGCYGHKPYKPIGYCDGGSWQLICTRGDWVWMCITSTQYGY